MLVKPRSARKSSKPPRDEPATGKQTKVSVRDDRFPGSAAPDPQVRHQMIARAAYFHSMQRAPKFCALSALNSIRMRLTCLSLRKPRCAPWSSASAAADTRRTANIGWADRTAAGTSE